MKNKRRIDAREPVLATRLVVTPEEQFAEGARLAREIRKNLPGLGYGS